MEDLNLIVMELCAYVSMYLCVFESSFTSWQKTATPLKIDLIIPSMTRTYLNFIHRDAHF